MASILSNQKQMYDILSEVENNISEYLNSDAGWHGLDINYHKPYVQRVWRQWGDYRVCLHKIQPCRPDEALYHPHPWPSIVRIVYSNELNSYHTGVGYGDPNGSPPPIAAQMALDVPSIVLMDNPNSWHYVAPTHEVYSLMIMSKPWDSGKSKSLGLNKLDSKTINNILNEFSMLWYINWDI